MFMDNPFPLLAFHYRAHTSKFKPHLMRHIQHSYIVKQFITPDKDGDQQEKPY